MDNLRGTFDAPGSGDDHYEYDHADTDTEQSRDLPPAAIGQDERRMQVRAYNHWASLLGDQPFPRSDDLDPASLTDFGRYSVLLDFSTGVDDPAVRYLGDELAEECGTHGGIGMLSDVPARSLLSRITDHYMQILANQAPIGFEAEFVNQRSVTIMYRGILLPYSSDGKEIDFIYGVINWKEIADQLTTDELLLEIDQALETGPHIADAEEGLVPDFADGPAAALPEPEPADEAGETGTFPQPAFGGAMDEVQSAAMADPFGPPDADTEDADEDYDPEASPLVVKKPSRGPALFELTPADELLGDEGEEEYEDGAGSDAAFASLDADLPEIDETDHDETEPEIGLTGAPADDTGDVTTSHGEPAQTDEPAETGALSLAHEQDGGLYDCLAEARELAENAKSTEDRSRSALYDAVGRAYDVSLAAQDAPEDFAELLDENGLTVQDRAPMTPVVKLVFGVDYDKTRLTEYATVLTHAHRANIGRGALSTFLKSADGGLKGVVAEERRLRREEAGERTDPVGAIRAKLAEKLRAAETYALDEIDSEGPEFGVVMIRRLPTGEVVVIGEVADDIPLAERVARKLVA